MAEELDIPSVLREGDPDLVAALVAAGRSLNYRTEHGYTALIDAVHGRDVFGDPRLLRLLQVLVDAGVDLNGVSTYNESGLRVLSRIGRFDGVGLLLKAGANREQLRWTPLVEAVAIGSLADVEREAKLATSLEETDYWSRTAWLVALLAGSIPKADLLRQLGANVHARGLCETPPLHYAVMGRHLRVIQWLLESGQGIEQTDDFGTTPLMCATETGNIACVRLLIAAGANINAESKGGHVLSDLTNREMIQLYLAAGASPTHLGNEARRALCGLGEEAGSFRGATRSEFDSAPTRRFGKTNPERMNEPFWTAMIRCGVSAYAAREHFDLGRSDAHLPTWCARRFGQSITLLPDGRAVLIAGEHEDHYDPDFCIYNDVFVIDERGDITIFGYPEESFPPTDFHSATLVGDAIIVIGSLGYHGTRRFGETPVLRLDLATFRMTRMETTGESPGWIHKHDAKLVSEHVIRVTAGTVATFADGKEVHSPNLDAFLLDLRTGFWRKEVLLH